MDTTKAELRSRLRVARATRTQTERAETQQLLTLELLKLIVGQGVRRLAAFLPTEVEPPIVEFLELAFYQGVTILIPRAHDDFSMTWLEYHPDHEVNISPSGVPEFSHGEGASSEVALNWVDLLLVPAAAVDVTGTRLGWGKGFYDRALVKLVRPETPVFAIVFDDEVLEALPRDDHDRPITGVVTPTRTLVFD